MTAHILKGSKQEIAQALANLEGEMHEAIVFVDDVAVAPNPTTAPGTSETVEEMFKEMEPYMVRVGHVDYSREGIYTRKPGE